jgi:hypothetical protein
MLVPSDSSLSQLTETYHLWPWVLLFLLFGVLGALSMAVRYCLHFLEEVQESFYDFKSRCAENRRHYEESVNRRRSSGAD